MPECDIDAGLIKQAQEKVFRLTEQLKKHSLTLALAESCTAGLISALLACREGASAFLWGCYVCYTKEAKAAMLGLDKNELDAHGLVSRETACLMANGALQKSGADMAASVTGLAGPDGDGSDVPVGTVWIATALKSGGIEAREFYFKDASSRNEVRFLAAIAVLDALLKSLSGE
ncbi:MAG: CinA family protein [Treponema sp.]|nr:CinA family protein [Treponema sp.]